MGGVRVFAGEVFEGHETGEHVESPARVRVLGKRLAEWKQEGLVETAASTAAPIADLLRVHRREHVENIRRVSAEGGGLLDPDTVARGDSFAVAVEAAGAALQATKMVVEGEDGGVLRSMAWVRPPGHHASADRAMGFCLFNNVAIAARHAVEACGLDRVLIVDWDVHHGNGTQEIFYEDAAVYFLSLHRAPFYPGTGSESETGALAGLGTTRNIPLAFGLSRRQYLDRFRSGLDEAVRGHRPELILLSAGFDAHHLDPVGSLGLESEDYASMTHDLVAAAEAYSEGRIVSVLEGGYHLDALVESVHAHLQSLNPG